MTNWEALFSTPEKTAYVLGQIKACCGDMGDSGCSYCPINDGCPVRLLEWLQEEAS